MLEVIGVGFGRTGTLSLKQALEVLGHGPCYHMFELDDRREHVDLWHRAIDGELSDWGEIFGDYRSAVDWPTCSFWRELASAYPSAKFILTEREPEAWYRSASTTIFPAMVNGRVSDDPQRRARAQMSSRLILSRTFDERFADKNHAIDVYRRHVHDVKAGLSSDRLLVMRINDGWSALCEFLSCAVPDVEFPHVNDGANDFQRRMEQKP